MKKGKKTFLSKDRGFHFVNRFDVADLIDWKLFDNWTKERPIFYGLCGGMCFAALDLFYGSYPVPAGDSPPDHETHLFKYLLGRQIDSLSFNTLKNVIAWTLQDDQDVATLTRQELAQIQSALDEGKPVVLALIRVHKRTPTANHQVLAIDYTLDEATGQMEITLYDPNHPGEEPVIFVDLSDGGPNARFRQSTGEALRGFFVIQYEPKTPRLA